MTAEFSMPAEWERHLRTWMCWPCRAEAWDGPEGLARARRATADIARVIARFEPVVMAARPEDTSEAWSSFLPPLSTHAGKPAVDISPRRCSARGGRKREHGIEVWEVPLDDSWARDIAPTFLVGPRGRMALHWRFNAWGGKYAPFVKDAAFAARVARKAGVPVRAMPLVCEGGALHSDGQGTLLTTAQCLLNPNRNPGLDREEVARRLRGATGAERVVWLDGIFSDTETDGHVDNIACFAGPAASGKQRVIVGVPASRAHPDHAPVRQAIAQLEQAGLEVVALAQPRAVRRDRQGRPLQASYVNFHFCNGGLVMPLFDDPHDEKAYAVLADCFPGRDIVMVPALDIVAGGGGIHCITRQEPAPDIPSGGPS